jgi:hypothetical protein
MVNFPYIIATQKNKIESPLFYLPKDKTMTSKDKSQKRKNNTINKTELWNIFETEIEDPCKKKIPLECVYGSGNREICERCETILAFSEEGFLTCTNGKCGIIYKDIVDHTAEWRY